MWDQHYDNVAGIDAVMYAETIGVPIIGTSSRFLSLSKTDFKIAASKYDILIPKYNVIRSPEDIVTLETFPLIVKSARECGNLYMTQISVCNNTSYLESEIHKMLNVVGCKILIEEYIFGREYSAIVIENTDGVYALNPIVYDFPDYFSFNRQFLYFNNKFKLVGAEEIKIKLVDEVNPLFNQIKEITCKSYNALHMHGCGYARVDLEVNRQSKIYILEINPIPAFFASIGNTFGDDEVILKCFEGGHEVLKDQLIKPKLKNVSVGHPYDVLSTKYDNAFKNSNITKMLKEVCEKYDYNGDVLNLGCSTGMIGKTITDSRHNSNFIGVDLSRKMVEHATLYSKIYIGPMENIIYDINDRNFDHILSIGCLLFLNKVVFEMGTKSITISIGEIPDEYTEILLKMGHGFMYSYNHKCVLDTFKVPN